METPLVCPACRSSMSFTLSFDETPNTWIVRCSVCRKTFRVQPLPDLPPGVPAAPSPSPVPMHSVSPQGRPNSDNLEEATASNFEVRFGKHEGSTLGEIQDEDEEYLVWLAEQDWVKRNKPTLYKALKTLGYVEEGSTND